MTFDANSPLGKIPIGWTVEKLSNLTTKIGSGSTPRGGQAAYLPKRLEYAFVRSQNVFDFEFKATEIKYISERDAGKLKGVHLKKDDVLLNITGDGVTFARCCIVPEDVLPAAVNQHVCIIRLAQSRCLPGYMMAYLCLPQIKEYIANFNAGGSRRAITKAHIESFDVLMPPLSVQKVIQSFTLDIKSKIKLNVELNQTLEQIAQSIFKSWFVDFEPVKAKIAAREALLADNPTATAEQIAEAEQQAAINAISGAGDVVPTEQLQTLADLFPNQLVESELGEIPEGWKVKTLTEFGSVVCGKTPSKKKEEYFGGDIPFIKIPDMHGGAFATSYTEYLSIEGANSQNKKQIPAGAVCVSCIATVGKVLITHRESHTNQQINSIVPQEQFLTEYLYFQMLNQNKLLHDLASGGSATLNLNTGNFSKIELLSPSDKVLKAYHHTVSPLFFKMLQNSLESEMLENLRDTLLPKLLSGEINLTYAKDAIDA